MRSEDETFPGIYIVEQTFLFKPFFNSRNLVQYLRNFSQIYYNYHTTQLLSMFTCYSRYGPFPMMYWSWDLIGENMQLCLAGLRDVDRLAISISCHVLEISPKISFLALSGNKGGHKGKENSFECGRVSSLLLY